MLTEVINADEKKSLDEQLNDANDELSEVAELHNAVEERLEGLANDYASGSITFKEYKAAKKPVCIEHAKLKHRIDVAASAVRSVKYMLYLKVKVEQEREAREAAKAKKIAEESLLLKIAEESKKVKESGRFER